MDTEEPSPRAADGALPEDNAAHGEPGTPHDLDQRLVGALERIGHVTRTMLAREAYTAGLSTLQLQLLQRLGPGTNSPRVSDLAQELDASQATISTAMSTLLRKDLVRKTQDPRDRRNTVVTLSPGGEELLASLDQWARPLEDQLAGLDTGDKGTALRLVLRLIADMQMDGVISIARTCLTCRFFDDTSHPTAALPYHCLLLDTAFADTELRVNCTEHEAKPIAPAS